MDDNRYMRGDSEMPEIFHSTDEKGGTLFVERGSALTGGGTKMRFDHRIYGSGRIVNPQFLPNGGGARLTGSGRVVNPEVLPDWNQGTEYLPAGQISWPPPMPMHGVGIDYEHAYHFGTRVEADCVRGSRRQ